MRVLLGVLTLAVVACGGEHDEPRSLTSATPPPAERSAAAEPEIPLERRLEPEHDFVVDIDVVALRKANRLPPDADIASDPDHRIVAGSALFYLMLNNCALAAVIDHRRITRVLYDGRSMAIATDQPYEEVSRALVGEHKATVDGKMTVGPSNEPIAVADGGAGALLVGLDPERPLAMQQRRDGGMGAKLRRALERVDGPIRAASLHREQARCVDSVAVGAGRGRAATAVITLSGKASRSRLRLDRQVGSSQFQFEHAKVDGSRLIVPYRWIHRPPTEILLDRPVYHC